MTALRLPSGALRVERQKSRALSSTSVLIVLHLDNLGAISPLHFCDVKVFVLEPNMG